MDARVLACDIPRARKHFEACGVSCCPGSYGGMVLDAARELLARDEAPAEREAPESITDCDFCARGELRKRLISALAEGTESNNHLAYIAQCLGVKSVEAIDAAIEVLVAERGEAAKRHRVTIRVRDTSGGLSIDASEPIHVTLGATPDA